MKKLAIFVTLFFYSSIFAQDITNTLASGGLYYVKDATNIFMVIKQATGLVGIGSNITDPKAQLEIGGTEGLLVRGTANTGTARQLGAGMRFHWYPRKGALRVGMAETTWWDDDGSSVPKLALYSYAMGYQPRATGTASYAFGAYCKALGDYSWSMGSYSQASGTHAIAIGTQVYASGIYSIAIGAGADTNYKDGSVVIGDDTYFQTAYASADNQLTMRFSGGYRFWSSYPDSTAGVYMRHGQSGWSNYSDRNKKENFQSVDGESLLSKISKIPVTTWNYKRTDTSVRYMGPMAQDFYAAFHLNGDDSLGISTISIDGVNFAGVQALEKRTGEMKKMIDEIKIQNAQLILENQKLKEKLSALDKIEEELAAIRNLKEKLSVQTGSAKEKNQKKNNLFQTVSIK